jgi:4-carboxymuconolactone decarboxylase
MTDRRMPNPPPRRASPTVTTAEQTLRQLAVASAGSNGSTSVIDASDASLWLKEAVPVPDLDARAAAIVRLAALIAVGASDPSYEWSVEAARAAGVTVDEILGTLLTVGPTVGLARLVAAIAPLALAAGYDIDFALESLDAPFGGLPDDDVEPTRAP